MCVWPTKYFLYSDKVKMQGESSFKPPKKKFKTQEQNSVLFLQGKRREKLFNPLFFFSFSLVFFFFFSLRGSSRRKKRRGRLFPDFFLPSFMRHPTNNTLLTNFRLSSDAKKIVHEHRPSIQMGAKRAKTCVQRVHVPTELPFCVPPLLVGPSWLQQTFS